MGSDYWNASTTNNAEFGTPGSAARQCGQNGALARGGHGVPPPQTCGRDVRVPRGGPLGPGSIRPYGRPRAASGRRKTVVGRGGRGKRICPLGAIGVESFLMASRRGIIEELNGGHTRRKRDIMTLQDVIDDIHALYEDLKVYERKYGILSETFYELYMDGHEPDNDDWVLDWSDWAGAYQILLRRREQYRQTVSSIKEGSSSSLIHLIGRASRNETIQIHS